MTFISRWPSAFCAAAVLASVACGHSDEPADEETPPVVAVDVAPVTAQRITESVNALGVVVPRGGSVVQMGAPAATRVAQVSAVVGQRVSRGDVLVEFDQAQFLANVERANGAVTAARQAYDRALRLADQGILPRREAEQAAATLASARADSTVAHREAQLSRIVAPMDGVITKMDALPGASVDVNTPLVEIADPSRLDALVHLTAGDAARVKRGARAELRRADAGDSAGVGAATVADIGAALDSTRAVPIRLERAGAEPPLRIGESIAADIAIAVHAAALTVPAEALVPEGEGFKVFVVDSDRVVHEREVTVRTRVSGRAEITKGLTLGERVVTRGAFGVEDGAHITTDTTPAPPAKR